MKKLFVFFTIVALTTLSVFGQWEVVKQGDELLANFAFRSWGSGFMLDANTGWYVARGGVVIKTTDGGASWTMIRDNDGSGIDWYDVEFVDANTGYVSAEDGYIFKTTDGGDNWDMIGDTANYTADLKFLKVIDANTVFFAGKSATLLKTTNGGTDYVKSGNTFESEDLDGGINFCSANVGVVASDDNGGYTWYTHDGGTTWNLVRINDSELFPYPITKYSVKDVGAGGDSTIVLGTRYQCILVSQNGGKSYSLMSEYTIALEYYYSVSVVDENTFILGGSNVTVKTADGGANWDTLKTGTAQCVAFVDFIDTNNGFVFAENNQWMKTTDGGSTFSPIIEWPNVNFRGIGATSNTIFITAHAGGEITTSNDGGLTWSYPTNYLTGAAGNLLKCEFFDDDNGIIVGGDGNLFITTDGGASWTFSDNPMYTVGKSIYTVAHYSADTIFAGGSSGYLMRSVDGGLIWSDTYLSATKSVYGILPLSGTTFIAVGQSGYLYKGEFLDATTIDDSLYTTGTSDDFNAIVSYGDSVILVSDEGAIFKASLDNLGSLNQIVIDAATDELNDIEFINDTLVYVAGSKGKIYRSEDTGQTWTAETSPTTETIYDILYTNYALWGETNNGCIIKLQFEKPIPITIAEAKVDADANFVPDLLDQSVLIQGIITTPNYDSNTSYFLQDATAGINLHAYSFASALNIGDEVLITGVIEQYKGLTEITPASGTDITVVSTGNDFDTTLVTIPDFGESIEGQLVQLNNVWLVEGSTWPSEGSYASLKITDGVDTLILRIDDDTDLDGWANSPSGVFNVIGVVGQYTYSDPADDGYQIMPRFQTDIFSVTVTIAVMIPGDGSYRSFWVNGSWDNNGAYNSGWSGDMVELTDADGDNIFVGTVDLMIDNTNTYGWWLGAENSTSTYVKSGADFQVLSSDPVFTDTLEIPSPWIITMPGSLNSWDPSDQNLTRTETVWASDSIFIAAGTAVEYKYAVGLSWHGDTNPFQTYGAEGYNAGGNITFTSETDALYIFTFDDADDSCTVTLVKQVGIEDAVALPKVFKVHQNYPNPFNPTTTMKFDLPKESRVSIHIYNMLGENVRTLADNKLFNAGYHQVIWNGVNNNGDQLSSGIYFYQVRTKNNLKTNRMLLLK